MNWENTTPEWVPTRGCTMRKTGLFFDAVRIPGAFGSKVAATLGASNGGEAGPVIGELLGKRWLYFVLPVGTVSEFQWPLEVERYSRMTPNAVSFIGIPALEGDTWPLFWFSRPTADQPYVDPALLHAAVLAQAEADTHA
ncbi:hypothetical protein [Streptomyces litchfieldiae]|uniref:Uncharacterized protein n=1 Tax=Streptomyces litchfieldiae TaxID=3075543 RepID=A0ABU2MKV8_9ACTN|nr:hypothetical protein [Streptomyces sp. DSM 44938]MDT0342072.1 hypothetical protein [Streptomyces sp. DSM 44938]